ESRRIGEGCHLPEFLRQLRLADRTDVFHARHISRDLIEVAITIRLGGDLIDLHTRIDPQWRIPHRLSDTRKTVQQYVEAAEWCAGVKQQGGVASHEPRLNVRKFSKRGRYSVAHHKSLFTWQRKDFLEISPLPVAHKHKRRPIPLLARPG